MQRRQDQGRNLGSRSPGYLLRWTYATVTTIPRVGDPAAACSLEDTVSLIATSLTVRFESRDSVRTVTPSECKEAS
jgi:hypothetical protein